MGFAYLSTDARITFIRRFEYKDAGYYQNQTEAVSMRECRVLFRRTGSPTPMGTPEYSILLICQRLTISRRPNLMIGIETKMRKWKNILEHFGFLFFMTRPNCVVMARIKEGRDGTVQPIHQEQRVILCTTSGNRTISARHLA
jgi:hypothetical protein